MHVEQKRANENREGKIEMHAKLRRKTSQWTLPPAFDFMEQTAYIRRLAGPVLSYSAGACTFTFRVILGDPNEEARGQRHMDSQRKKADETERSTSARVQ